MTSNPLPLNDAMPPRSLAARWVVCGVLELKTALHLGGDGDEQVDMPVLRDERTGCPLLPGTTLAGALRNALADRLAGYGAPERPEVAALFGGNRGDDDGSQSPLIVFDALGRLPPEQAVEIRDGVSISPKSGTAEDLKKYDYEVIPARTKFPVRLDLLVPGGGDQAGEQALLGLLAGALDTFADGHSAFGAKRSRGLGRVTAVWTAKRFALDSEAGWLEWICSDHEKPLPEPSEADSVAAFKAAAPAGFESIALPPDTRSRVVIELNLKVEHDILVRSPGTEPDASDVSHLRSGGTAILPGTSLAGVMRAQALRIARLVRDGQGDADAWVDRIFGPRFEGQRPSERQKLRSSRLRVGESALDASLPQRQARIAIDRFTGGVVSGALFDEQTEINGTVTVQLELRRKTVAPKDRSDESTQQAAEQERKRDEASLGLVLLVLKDLLDGSLPVGGTSSVGRGVLKGTGIVTWHNPHGPCSAMIEPGKVPTGDGADRIDQAIKNFHDLAALAASEAQS